MKFKRGVYFLSDTHLSHWNCNAFCNRGFSAMEEMDSAIIKSINDYVKENDTLYLLGDAIWSTGDYTLLNKINCKNTILIIGNHDKGRNDFLKNGIKLICQEMIVKIGGFPVRLSHYPYKYGFWRTLLFKFKVLLHNGVWPNNKRYQNCPVDDGKYLLHGHHHSGNIENGRMFNVCWDLHKRPVNIQEIESWIQRSKQ